VSAGAFTGKEGNPVSHALLISLHAAAGVAGLFLGIFVPSRAVLEHTNPVTLA